MVRWGLLFVALIVLAMPFVAAHKSPVIEYAKHGVWRSGYSFIPRQPVVGETITITEQVWHMDSVRSGSPNSGIQGNVTMVFSVYRDDSINEWYAGERYKRPDWLLMHNAPGQPMQGYENKFSTDLVINEPGNYFVTVDLYENGQYIGQDMRSLDVEQRSIGPMYMAFSAFILLAVLYGVKKRVL
jgi:hypothetical protein